MINNHGIINIGNNNVNIIGDKNKYVVRNALVLEIQILLEKVFEPDKKYLEEIIENILSKQDKNNKSLIKKLSKKTIDLIEKLGLTLILEYVKQIL